jgi:arsenate reductase
MAEAFVRARHHDRYDVASAGVSPTKLDPLAVRVMSEAGLDLSVQQPKHVSDLAGFSPGIVITVCNHARETCPVFPGRARVLHRGFDDPPALHADDPDRAVDEYRRVRDEIRDFVETLPEFLQSEEV